MKNRSDKVTYDSQGDTKRYALDILDYCVLAGLMLKDYKGKYFFREDALDFLKYFKDHAPLFRSYKKEQSLQEIEAVKPLWIDFVNDSSNSLLKSFEEEISKDAYGLSDGLAFSTKQIGDEGEALT